MPAFRFEAIDAAGKAQKGVLDADSARGARTNLRSQGLTPLIVEPAATRTRGERNQRLSLGRRLSQREQAILTRQLASLLIAGLPLDEALSRVVIDFSGRPGLEFHVPFTRARIGTFDVDLTIEFFRGFVNHAGVTLHIDNLRGINAHHQVETVFKAFGRALRMAVELDERAAGQIPSTKGSL